MGPRQSSSIGLYILREGTGTEPTRLSESGAESDGIQFPPLVVAAAPLVEMDIGTAVGGLPSTSATNLLPTFRILYSPSNS